MAKGIQHLLRLSSNRFLFSIQRFSFFIKEKAKTLNATSTPGCLGFKVHIQRVLLGRKDNIFGLILLRVDCA